MAIEVHIKKKYPGFTLQVDFESNQGILGILGASGCGKSMTLKCIAGIVRPDAGRIVLNGRVLFDGEHKINLPVQKRKVGFLFQNYALFPKMTVAQNIACGGGDVEGQIKRFRLEGLEKRYPHELSGGQQQRVAFARMMAGEPEIIMLDEPFSALDGYLKEILQEEMLEVLKEYDKDVLLVTHSRDEIYKFCDHISLIKDGNSILTGNTREVFKHPGLLEAAKLTGCKNFSAIERLSARELWALDWNLKLNTCEDISENITHVGIRGHWIAPTDNPDEENVMEAVIDKCVERPFEEQVIFRNAMEENGTRIWWMRPKHSFDDPQGEGFTGYMKFPAEHLMLLVKVEET